MVNVWLEKKEITQTTCWLISILKSITAVCWFLIEGEIKSGRI